MSEEYLKTRFGKIKLKELVVKKIPDNPRIKLPEYISSLYDSEIDKKSASISLKLIKNKLVNLNKNVKLKLKEVKWCRAGSSPHKIKLPKFLDPKLAYLAGYLHGDGGFKDIRKSYNKNNRFEHKIIVGDEFEIQINRIKLLFKDLFNLNTTMRKERIEKGERLYYLNPTCKIVYRFFTKVLGFTEGPKRNIKIPKIIKAAPSNLMKWYLRGFVDADGDVRATEYYRKKPTTPRFKVRLADKNFVFITKQRFGKACFIRVVKNLYKVAFVRIKYSFILSLTK